MSRKKSERELQQIQQNLEYQTWELKVFLADVVSVDISKNENLEDRMIELENLVNTYWWIVILEHIQKKAHPDYDTYIGWWKLDEIISEMQLKWANLLIIWNILKPSQIYKINEKLRKIWVGCDFSYVTKNLWYVNGAGKTRLKMKVRNKYWNNEKAFTKEKNRDKRRTWALHKS